MDDLSLGDDTGIAPSPSGENNLETAMQILNAVTQKKDTRFGHTRGSQRYRRLSKREEESEEAAEAEERSLLNPRRGRTCQVVCRFCAAIANSHVAALCESECLWNGKNFRTCLTVFSLHSR